MHDLGESSRQQPYLVLEYADRGTLADRVQALRRTGWTAAADDVLVLARSLAAALEAVHEAHLVHRDLSPANVLLRSAARTSYEAGTSVLVSDDEQVLLADLGLCKDLALNSGLTAAGGTSGFRHPEQHTTAVIDARADLWAMSALVAWLCEGADLPSGLATALQRSLAEAPSERHHPGSAGDSDLATTSPRSRGRIAAVLVVLLLIGALGGGLLAREMASPVEATSTARIDIEGPAEVRVGASGCERYLHRPAYGGRVLGMGAADGCLRQRCRHHHSLADRRRSGRGAAAISGRRRHRPGGESRDQRHALRAKLLPSDSVCRMQPEGDFHRLTTYEHHSTPTKENHDEFTDPAAGPRAVGCGPRAERVQ